MRRPVDDRGFSLIEASFVLVFIAGLLAITVPAWAGTRDRGHDAQAESTVAVSLRVARGALTAPGGVHPPTDQALPMLNGQEPTLVFFDEGTPAENPREVSTMSVPDGRGQNHDLMMVTRSESGRCFAVRDNVALGTWYTTWTGAPCVAAGTAVMGLVWTNDPGPGSEPVDPATFPAIQVPVPPAWQPGDPAISPVLECTRDNGDGTITAVWGYMNRGPETVSVPTTGRNFFHGTPDRDMGQPIVFDPGRHRAVFTHTFPASAGHQVWTLTSRTATANAGSHRCS